MANKEATLWLKIKTAGEESLDRVKDLLGTIGKVGAIAFGALSAAVVKAVAEAREQEEATNALTRAMINNGTYSKSLLNDYQAQANALSKLTLYEGEHITAAQATVAQYAGNIKITKELTGAILDFATANKMDAASAAAAVGKAIGTSTNALARYGIEINSSASQSEKMAQVLEGLKGKFGGQAEAAAQGLGILEKLQKTVNDLFQELGERLAPAIVVVAKSLESLLSNSSSTTLFIDALAGAFEFAARLAMNVAFAFESLGATIGGTIGTIVGSMEQLVNGQFKAAGESLVSGFEAIGQKRAEIQERYNQKVLELDAAFSQKKADNDLAEEEKLKESLARKKDLKAQASIDEHLAEQERKVAQMQEENALIGLNEEQKIQTKLQALDRQIQNETNAANKLKLLKDKEALLDQQRTLKSAAEKKKADEEELRSRQQTLGSLSALQHSKSKEMAAVGKASAIAEIGMNTYKGALAAYSAMAGIPYIGPALGIAAAAALTAYGAEQARGVASVQLAEGGVVRARPGGVQATIGEGGQDEAVIPLDRAGEFMGGGNTIQLTVYGGLLGDQQTAYEFIKIIDKGLLELRRNNESVSFDSGVA